MAEVAAGTCSAYGGIHAMQSNPTGCMGLRDYLGHDWKSAAGFPIINGLGCPVQPDNFMEVVLYLLYMAAGMAPVIPLDEEGRPTWLFGKTVHEGCDRGSYYEQGQFATEYGSPLCLVKLVARDQWSTVTFPSEAGWLVSVVAQCRRICIGCTMPGFPDKFMPFMDAPPGSKASTSVIGFYGSIIKGLRNMTQSTANKEPSWRHKGRALTTGYTPRW